MNDQADRARGYLPQVYREFRDAAPAMARSPSPKWFSGFG